MHENLHRHPLRQEIEGCLDREGATDAALHTVLDRMLHHFDCAVGTLHSFDAGSALLHLRAYRGLPETLLDRVRAIPMGKGMAGLAAERRAPVQVCNLQTDTSGMARPGARETKMEGSIAVPMLADSALRGVLGVAKPIRYEFTEPEVALLMDLASAIGNYLDRAQGRPVS